MGYGVWRYYFLRLWDFPPVLVAALLLTHYEHIDGRFYHNAMDTNATFLTIGGIARVVMDGLRKKAASILIKQYTAISSTEACEVRRHAGQSRSLVEAITSS